MSDAIREFTEKLQALPTPEEKIAFGLGFMRQTISQEGGSPRFREFWEARRHTLPLFKEKVDVSIRSKLWGEFMELTQEARKLKEMLEQESTFAMEQIDLAIVALEADVARLGELLAEAPELPFSPAAGELYEKRDQYNAMQRELNLLNTLASRLNGLRKEILKTDMRIRFKTKFLKRLSELGDKIFPRRKELIDGVSSEFERDVTAFVERYFAAGQVGGARYFELREAIKALQSTAKLLTLSSEVFTRTRVKLSECWDLVRELEKERKRFVAEVRQANSEKVNELQARIVALAGTASLRELDAALEEVSREMRGLAELTRDDVRFLRDEMSKVRAPLAAVEADKQRELEQQERARQKAKRDRIDAYKARAQSAGKETPAEGLADELTALEGELNSLEVTNFEKQNLDRLLRPLRHLVAEHRERVFLTDDQRHTLENLRAALDQKKKRRAEIKEQLEQHRRSLASSGLDFEKAMALRESIEQEKEQLAKVEEGIEELETKMTELD